MRHIIPISGKDSLAAAVVQMELQPNLPYELLHTDVGVDMPEVYAWLTKVEKCLQRPIVMVGKSLEQVIDEQGMLPSPQVRFCTRIGKIEPMEQYIGGDQATVYFGIRADEERTGYVRGLPNINAVFP
jgi:3'-phosphoadenosine 5'-phosphosulfate sulfotransferase (PAPS reductase)/FAD synthetase